MKHPGLSGPEPSGLFGPSNILGPGLRAFSSLATFWAWAYFWASVYFQSQDPHNFIVQPDPSKDSHTISQAGLVVKQCCGQAGLVALQIFRELTILGREC